ncbi:MAG: ABC transporter permease [Candidatus Dormibacteria bacterium]|jgi:ABC-2 type transport system permease protein
MSSATPERAVLSPRRAVYLIARREFMTRIRGKVFIIGTIVAVALLALYAVLQLAVIDRINTTTTFKVGFSGPATALAQPLESASPSLGFKVHVSDIATEAQGRSDVRAGSIDALVEGTPGAPQVVVKTGIDPTLQAALVALAKQEVLSNDLSAAGLSPAAVESQVNAASIRLDILQPATAAELQGPIIGFVMAFALYVFIGIYGGVIGQGVVAEKASRVVEILLSTVRPGQLLLGKVIGIGLVGLIQLGIIALCGLLLTVPTGVLALPGAAIGAVLIGVMWFVLGFILYALMLAATASLVSRVEEVSSATVPVTMLLVVTWLLAYVVAIPAIDAVTGGGTAPHGLATLTTILSLIPPFTPVLMSIRMAAGEVPLWEGLLAVALVLASIIGVTWLGARIYANSILRFGARIRILEALRRSP